MQINIMFVRESSSARIANSTSSSPAEELPNLFAFSLANSDDSLTNIMFLLSGVEKEVVKRNLKELLQDQNPEVFYFIITTDYRINFARFGFFI
jgi:ATP-dependent Clp protease ATP-binding subunit ClpC